MIDYGRLESLREELTAQFRTAELFRWLMVDGFLEADAARRLHEDFGPAVERSGKRADAPKKHKHVLRKIGIPRLELMGPSHRQFFEEIQSPRFLAWLQDVTGIAPIYADPELNGGGLHEIHRGGYLNVHTDFNFHPTTSLHRRLNILYYLNPVWEDAWEGTLELWRPDLSEKFAEIAPVMNRMAIFETSEISFHGHPKPLNTPAEVTRRSLATYYYSDWPEGLEQRAKTNYRLVPWQRKELKAAIAAGRAKGLDDDQIVDSLADRYQPADVMKLLRKVPA